MPNHITNRLTIIAGEDRTREILETVKDDEHGPGSIDFEKVIPMPEGIFRGNLGRQEKALYGKNNWYDWSLVNWGTKWNSYGYDDFPKYEDGNEILFMTAWSRPEPVIQRLSEMFPDVRFRHVWADEDIGVNVGEALYQNGEELESHIPANHSKEAFEMASEIQRLNLEEIDYYFNEESGTYEYFDVGAGDGSEPGEDETEDQGMGGMQ